MSQLFYFRDEDIYCHHTREIEPNPDEFSMLAHESFEIFYFISGSGSYLVEGNSYPLEPGDILLLRPAETHKLMISREKPYERISIHFSASVLSSLDPEEKLLRPFYDRPLGQGNRFSAAQDPEGRIRRAFEDFSGGVIPDPRLHVIARLLMVLTVLSGLYQGSVRPTAPARGLQGRIVDYVNDHLFEDISLQSVSDVFFRSRSQVSRLFHQATGTSFWEYVTIKRLMAARAMIQRGESAGNAAAACGFSDYSTFFRAYRAHFQHAPREDSRRKD